MVNKKRIFLKQIILIFTFLFFNQTTKTVSLPLLAVKGGLFLGQVGGVRVATATTGFFGSLTKEMAQSKDTNNLAHEVLRAGGVLLGAGATTAAGVVTLILVASAGVNGFSIGKDIYTLSQGNH